MNTPHSPLSPHLSIIRWLPNMLASVLHRFTGISLLLGLVFYLCFLAALSCPATAYAELLLWMHSSFGRLSLWVLAVVLFFHWLNGLRFLCFDASLLQTRTQMRLGSRVSLMLGLLWAVLMGVLLW